MNRIKLLRVLKLTAIIAAIVAHFGAAGQAQTPVSSPPISKLERENVEKIVHEYLIAHPEIIREAIQALQKKEENQKRLETAENMKKLASQIYADGDSPILGNVKGDVTVVVFYDYFCGYCRKTLPLLQTVLAKDSLVRVVYKEYPILGPQSQIAARAALAAGRQGKFAEFHQAMLAAEGAGDRVLRAISGDLKLDYAKLQKDMDDPKIGEAIDRNTRLAKALNVDGTPAYLVGDQLIPGAVDSEFLLKLIKAQREKLAKIDRGL